MCVDESHKDQGQPKGGGAMSPQKGNTIDLTITSAYDPISVDNTDDKLIITRAPIETDKLYYKSAACTSYYSSSNPITASTSALYPSAT